MSIFRNDGETYPISRDDVNDPDWIVADILSHNPYLEPHQFWFEFPDDATTVIAQLLRADAIDAR